MENEVSVLPPPSNPLKNINDAVIENEENKSKRVDSTSELEEMSPVKSITPNPASSKQEMQTVPTQEIVLAMKDIANKDVSEVSSCVQNEHAPITNHEKQDGENKNEETSSLSSLNPKSNSHSPSETEEISIGEENIEHAPSPKGSSFQSRDVKPILANLDANKKPDEPIFQSDLLPFSENGVQSKKELKLLVVLNCDLVTEQTYLDTTSLLSRVLSTLQSNSLSIRILYTPVNFELLQNTQNLILEVSQFGISTLDQVEVSSMTIPLMCHESTKFNANYLILISAQELDINLLLEKSPCSIIFGSSPKLLKKKKKKVRVQFNSEAVDSFTLEEHNTFGKEAWFQPKLPKQETEELLQAYPNGTFFIRSGEDPHTYVLSIKHKGKVSHTPFSKEKRTLKEVLQEAEYLSKTIQNVEEQVVSLGFDRELVQKVLKEEPKLSVDELVSRLLSESNASSEENILIRQKQTMETQASLKMITEGKIDQIESLSEFPPLVIPNIETFDWYFGDLGRKKAEDIVSNQCQNCLLVRDSAQGEGYVISTYEFSTKKVFHYLIVVTTDCHIKLQDEEKDYASFEILFKEHPSFIGFTPLSRSKLQLQIRKALSRKSTTKFLKEVDTIDSVHTIRLARNPENKDDPINRSRSVSNVDIEAPKYQYSATITKRRRKQKSWVVLDNDELVPGENISGKIYSIVKKPIRINKIMLMVEVKTKVFNGVVSYPGTMSYTQEIIAQHRIKIWKSSTPMELKIGEYCWPFSVNFPTKDPLPSASYKDISYVWWSVQSYILPQELAEVDTLHRKEIRYLQKKGLTSSPVVIYMYGSLKETYQSILSVSLPLTEEVKLYGGNINAKVNLPKSIYKMGEVISGEIEVAYKNSLTMNIEFIQIVNLTAPKFKKLKFGEGIISASSIEKKGSKNKKNNFKHTFQLEVPLNEDNSTLRDDEILPSYTTQYFNIQHFVKITIHSHSLSLRARHFLQSHHISIPIKIYNPIVSSLESKSTKK